MAEQTPAASTDSTILKPIAPVKTPEGTLYDKPATPPAADPAPAAPPTGTPPVTPPDPAAPVTPPAASQEPPKEGEPKTPPAEGAKPPADYDLKLPEGSPLSADDLAATLKDAKAAGQTKEQAEKTLEIKDQAVRTALQRQGELVKQVQAEWKSAVAKDPEIGGDALAENVELAKRAWDKLASPELKRWADQTGLGNNPEVVRLMVRVGKLIGEDGIVRGTSGAAPKSRNPEDVLYGNPKSPSEAMA